MSKLVKRRINLPAPSTINYMWNFGSLLLICLVIQILRGLFLTFHYVRLGEFAFESVIHLTNDVNGGWIIRFIHANGASIFFFFCYFHIGRGLFYISYNLILVWLRGVIILFVLIGVAFIGYVLPWGQISFWGATVITNLISAIPYIGRSIVIWIWGGFSVGFPTLTRFFSLHFFLPFVLLFLIGIHLYFLHVTGSRNPVGLNINLDKIQFHWYFEVKDLVTVIIALMLLFYISFIYPYLLIDPDNFILSNPIVTPIHIQPEWYFLFAYAILRSIPNKLGGVIALVISILVVGIFPFYNIRKIKGNRWNISKKLIFWLFVFSFIFLTWIGSLPVEDPFIFIGQIISFIYFFFLLIFFL